MASLRKDDIRPTSHSNTTPSASSIDEILGKLAKESWVKGSDGLFLSIEGDFGAALEPAKQALLADLLEIVGEDEAEIIADEYKGVAVQRINYDGIDHNIFRESLRQKLREYFGEVK